MLTDNPSAPMILVVEDDKDHARLIQHSFENVSEEYCLKPVCTLRAARVALEQRPPALVLTDYRLPDGEGSDLVALAAGACPVIIMTSHGNEQIAVEAMKIGAQDYIVKTAEAFEALPRSVALALKTWSLILARRQAEQAVIRAKKDWERTFDAVPDLIAIIDINHTITRVNKAMADRCGITVAEIVGRKCYEVVHGLNAAPCCCPSIGMMQDAQVHKFEIEEKRLNGFFDVTVSPLFDEPGSVIAFVHVMRDITGHKRAEERLRENQNRFRTLLDTIPDLIWLKDADGVYLACNATFGRFFGATETDIVGKTDYDFVEKEVADYFREHDRKAMAADGPSSNEEWVTFADDGHRALLYTTKIPMYEAGGSLIGVLGVGRDLTDLKHAQEDKIKLESQLQQAQKMESVGRLAGGVAHDFNNMLCVILGHAELGLMHLGPANPVCNNLKEIKNSAERSADLTRQLLAFARKQSVVPKVIDLNETITSMLNMLQRLIGEDIQLVWQPAPELCLIKVDPSQIDQILANLCVNARDAIEDIGRITIEIGTCSIDADYCAAIPEATPGEYVRLTVSDNGTGMDKETISRIFEPFYTTKELGKGTGLGLATVYGAIKQNNGFVNVYSEPGQGTTFSLYLPRYVGQKSEQQTEGGTVPVPRGQETILLVEDEPAILNMAATMLENQGYTVLKAGTPGEASRLAREQSGEIHLLMTDVIMPEMNGRNLAKNILTMYPRIKCLFMSGYTADVIAHYGVLDEGVHFIQKPFSLSALAAQVRELLDGE